MLCLSGQRATQISVQKKQFDDTGFYYRGRPTREREGRVGAAPMLVGRHAPAIRRHAVTKKAARLDDPLHSCALFPGGEGGIRTHGTAGPYNGFRDRPIQPLWHLPPPLWQLGASASGSIATSRAHGKIRGGEPEDNKKARLKADLDGGLCRARTYDPLIKSQLLCQLS